MVILTNSTGQLERGSEFAVAVARSLGGWRLAAPPCVCRPTKRQREPRGDKRAPLTCWSGKGFHPSSSPNPVARRRTKTASMGETSLASSGVVDGEGGRSQAGASRGRGNGMLQTALLSRCHCVPLQVSRWECFWDAPRRLFAIWRAVFQTVLTWRDLAGSSRKPRREGASPSWVMMSEKLPLANRRPSLTGSR